MRVKRAYEATCFNIREIGRWQAINLILIVTKVGLLFTKKESRSITEATRALKGWVQ